MHRGGRMIEGHLIRIYRKIAPRWLADRISSDTKDRGLRLWRFMAARPGPALLWRCGQALRVQTFASDPARAANLWSDIALLWPGGPAPELIRTAQRRALLAVAARSAAPEGRATALNRALMTLHGPHELKTDERLLAALRRYVDETLPYAPLEPRHADDTAAGLRRIVFCLDILKVSGTYTHGRMLLAMCANLLATAPELRIDLVITNECLAAGQGATPSDASALQAIATASIDPAVAGRLRLHVLRAQGLEAVAGACALINALSPELLVFGGGHRGPVSNESRAVRRCLVHRYPTAIFLFQVSDQVDDECDLILARGPHRIEGRAGTARVRIAPYPTHTPALPRPAAMPPRPAEAPPMIVSAIVGARMEARLDELGSRELRRFLSLLDAHPGACWHFIGALNPERLITGNRLLAHYARQGKVVAHALLPPEQFRALVGQASLFLHLPGFTGGSGGAGIARTAGVPILCFAHSDVSGRQPPETVFEAKNVDACIRLAEQVLARPEVARRLTSAQANYTTKLRETSALGFLDALTDARDTGLRRLKYPTKGSAQTRG